MAKGIQVAKSKITIALQAGSKRDVYASWTFSHDHTDKYEYEWEYTTSGVNAKKQIWFDGGTGSVEHPTKTATYSTPANATKIRFRVKPVAKTHKVNKEDTAYYNGSWSSWKEFWWFEFSSNPDPWQVASADLKIVKYLKGTALDSQPYVEVTWPVKEPSIGFGFKYLKGYDYKWEYRQDADYTTAVRPSRYVDAESGSVSDLTEAEKTDLAKGKEVYRSVRLPISAETIGDTTFAVYDGVRCTITPTATEDGAFKPVSNTVGTKIRFDTIKVKEDDIIISASKSTEDYTAFWTLPKNHLDHVASFDVSWEYADDPRNYFDDEARAIEDIWVSGGTGSVNKSEGETLTTFGEAAMRWRFTFKPTPIGNGIYPTVRLKVKAVCDDTKSFIEEDSAWKVHEFTVPTKELESLTLTTPNPMSPKHVKATWEAIYDPSIASYSYSYRYTTSSKGAFSNPSTGSVDASQGQNGSSNPSIVTYAIEFDAPSDAKTLEFSVQPVPNVATAFVGDALTETINFKGATVLTVTNLKVYVRNKTERVVYATWDPLNVSKIVSSGVSLEDLGIPGSVDDYPIEDLYSLVRSAILSGYDVKWQYYFLDRWIDGTGSATTQSTMSDFTVPEEASKFRVTVKPTSSKEDIMVGAYCKYVEQSVTPKPLKPSSSTLTLDWYGDEDMTLAAKFTDFKKLPAIDTNQQIDADEYKTLPNVIFQWSFFRYGGWESVEEETVTPSFALDYLLSTKEVPTNAKEARVRIRPDINTLAYYGLYSEYVTLPVAIPGVSVVNLTVSIQKGTKRTCVATWADSPEIQDETVSGYSYEWQYSIDNIWYDGNNGDASITALNSTYDAPDNAELVRVRVKPNPLLSKYFVGEWTSYVTFKVPDDITPEVPSVPSVEMVDIYNFKATVDTYDTKTSSILFEVVNETDIWRKDTIDVDLNRAVFQFPVAAGHVYRVRAAGVNTEGEQGEWSNYSSDVASAPPPLSSPPEIRATSDNSVEITWTAPATGVIKSYKIEYTTSQSYFDAAPSLVQSQDIETGTTAILRDLDPSEWFFRICAVNDAGQSDWIYADSIFLGSVPTAPTTWSSRTSATIGEEVLLYWTHNCADESAESKAELVLIVNGGEPITYEITPPEDGGISYYVLTNEDVSGEATVEWYVRTMGVVQEYGDWSTQRIVKFFSPPSLLIRLGSQANWEWDSFNFNTDNIYTSAGSITPFADNIVTSFPILVYLDAFPPTQTPTSYIMTVISNNSYEEIDETGRTRQISIGQEIFKKYYNTQNSSFTTILTPDLIDLENGMSYTINVTVAMDSGLTAEASETFSVEWDDEDYILNAETAVDMDALVAYVRPYAMDDNEQYPSNVMLSVFRREFDGSYVKIGSRLSNIDRPVVVDPHPALDYARYRIVAQSTTTGAISYYDLPAIPIKETSVVIQWDEEWSSYTAINEDAFSEQPWTGSMIKLPYNVKVSDSNEVDIEAVEYIGRRHPVSYYGTQVGQKMTISSDIDKQNKELIYSLRRLAVYMGNVYIREPNGAGYWAHVSIGLSMDYDSVIVPVSIDVTRVEGGM